METVMTMHTEPEIRSNLAHALAAAYTVPVNSGKELDVDLIEAMISNIMKLIAEKPTLFNYPYAP
jgi:hypothetical protein